MSKELKELYDAADARVRLLESVHAARINCRKGCSSCCVDGISVFDVEARNIRARHAELLSDSPPHPSGACAFLDQEGACRIYEDRPYVCRTQGIPLRWVEYTDSDTVEYRDICPLNEEGGKPVEQLDPEDCLTIGEFEGRLAELQKLSGDGEMLRVSLRSLFIHES